MASRLDVDWFNFGIQAVTPAAMEQRLQSWGVSAGKKIVIYGRGADIMATRLFFDLYYHGVPADDLFILDGGLAKWEESGGAVTKDRPPPRTGERSKSQCSTRTLASDCRSS